jgi:hypothetical protein
MSTSNLSKFELMRVKAQKSMNYQQHGSYLIIFIIEEIKNNK